jgi:hypothetical protein
MSSENILYYLSFQSFYFEHPMKRVVHTKLDMYVSIFIMCTSSCSGLNSHVVAKIPISPVSSTNKTDRHDMTEILLKVTLSTIKQTNKQTKE